MFTVVIFLLILSFLVLAHEFGHFIVARKTGMRVYEFGLGFPPRFFGVYLDPKTKKLVWVKGCGKSNLNDAVDSDSRGQEFPATLYSLNILPLGGFCKIKGESGEEAKDEDSFASKGAGKKLAVLVAGVSMNFLVAAILLSIGFSIGIPTSVQGDPDEDAIVPGTRSVMIQQTIDKSPARNAGLKLGDKIISLDGIKIESSSQLVEYVNEHGDKTMKLEYETGKEVKTVDIAPSGVGQEDGKPRLGLMLTDAALIRYPWHKAIYMGFYSAGIGLINIFLSLFVLVKGLLVGRGLVTEVSGPVGIAAVVGKSAQLGISYLINVTSMISLSLAAINILPIPALDGGRALFVIIEKIFKKPVPMKYEQLAHTIGFLLLMVLVVVVTVRDVLGLIH